MTSFAERKVLALSGGVGGAKLALGLSKILTPAQLTIVANTGDDFEHLGLPISPDLDTVMYTLAGRNNQEQGWGLADETWQAMEMLRNYAAPTWFQLGDKDIATHLVRRQMLAEGKTLSEVSAHLCRQLGVEHCLLPMSDDPVQTWVDTDAGELPFQTYFVGERCRPTARGFRFAGIATAQPQPGFMTRLADPQLSAIVICPSNPFVSVDPILQLAGVRAAMAQSAAPVIAVSPIVAGAAIKGPTAKMMAEAQMPVSALGVAEHYGARADGALLDGFVIDEADADQVQDIERLGIAVHATKTVMHSLQDRIDLARSTLEFALDLAARRKGG
ncbi:MAG: 2-phospho-L-lactate transferase [Rhodocyclaceae bacterium]|nr:2-phospho-L-lactate transferase [Rhodocyclaceae bacterium]